VRVGVPVLDREGAAAALDDEAAAGGSSMAMSDSLRSSSSRSAKGLAEAGRGCLAPRLPAAPACLGAELTLLGLPRLAGVCAESGVRNSTCCISSEA
jgi:hypothetical protein